MTASATRNRLVACTTIEASGSCSNARVSTIGTGGDQQTDGADEEPQPDPVGVAGIFRELIESVVEHSTKAEPQQDLSPEDQDPGFLEGDLNLLRQLHS